MTEYFDTMIFLTSIGFLVMSCFLQPQKWHAKIVLVIAVLFGATLIVTGLLRLLPGNPVDHILGDQAPEAARILLGQDLGLIDQQGNPTGFITQYGQFIYQMLTNQLLSYRTRDPVFSTILSRLPYTIWLAVFSLFFALLIGPLLGLLAAYRKNTWVDWSVMFFTLIGISIPRFFLGPLLLLFFSIHLQWLPVSGASDGLFSVVLPALSLGLAMAAIQARITRASVLEVTKDDYIRTARAKGLSEKTVFVKHAMRNALLPLVTIIGMEFAGLLAGTVVTEKIFNWPGIGLLLLESIQALDMPLVQGIVITIAFGFVLVNLVTDFIYQAIDPRIKIN